MSDLGNIADHPTVFREQIKEHRGTYYVTYQPADARFQYAFLTLTILGQNCKAEAACSLLENELEQWLRRFPVLLMATAWDNAENGIKNPRNKQSILMGYIGSNGSMIKKWGTIRFAETPSTQADPEYLERVYSSVPFLLQDDVRKTSNRTWRRTVMIAKSIVLFVVVIPVLIEIVSLGVTWLGYLLSGISITAGLYKIASTAGWVKPSKRKRQKEEEERRMAHYFYHCERNAEGFNRLKMENYQRDAVDRTRKESDEIRSSEKAPIDSGVGLPIPSTTVRPSA